MEVHYERSHNKNYLVLKDNENGIEENYQVKMLKQNQIEHLLSLSTSAVDGCLQYEYDITSCQPLSRIIEISKIKEKDIQDLINHLEELAQGLDAYMLDDISLLLDPEFIYKDMSSGEYRFVYAIGQIQDFSKGFKSLMEYVLENLDHNDKNAVVLAYGIYRKVIGGISDLKELKKVLEHKQDFQEGQYQHKRIVTQIYPTEEEGCEQQSGINETQTQSRSNQRFKESKTGHKKIIRTVLPEMVEQEEEVPKKTGLRIWKILRIVAVIGGIFVVITLIFPQYTKLHVSMLQACIMVGVCAACYKLADIRCKRLKYETNVHMKTEEIPYYFNEESDQSTKKADWNAERPDKNTERPGQNAERPGQYTERPDRNTIKSDQIVNESDWKAANSNQNSAQCDLNTAEPESEDNRNREQLEYSIQNEYNKQHAHAVLQSEEKERQTRLLSEYIEDSEQNMGIVLENENNDEQIVIDHFPFLIGSSKKECDYTIDSIVVSRMHLRLSIEHNDETGEILMLEDLNSTNGTQINGRLLAPFEKIALQSDDKLVIADRSYTVMGNMSGTRL